MAREHHGGAGVERVSNGRQRRTQSRVVANLPVFHWDVEVDANEDALALEVDVFDRKFWHGECRVQRTRPTGPFSPACAADRRSDSNSPTRCRTRREP